MHSRSHALLSQPRNLPLQVSLRLEVVQEAPEEQDRDSEFVARSLALSLAEGSEATPPEEPPQVLLNAVNAVVGWTFY